MNRKLHSHTHTHTHTLGFVKTYILGLMNYATQHTPSLFVVMDNASQRMINDGPQTSMHLQGFTIMKLQLKH